MKWELEDEAVVNLQEKLTPGDLTAESITRSTADDSDRRLGDPSESLR